MTNDSRSPYVLVIDDEWRLASNIVRYLERRGLHARAVTTVESAYQSINSRTPDFAIVDLRLPGYSGIDFCKHVHLRFPSLAVVVVSARVEPDEHASLESFGVLDVLTKPFSMSSLSHLIENNLNLSTRPKNLLAEVTGRMIQLHLLGIGGTG